MNELKLIKQQEILGKDFKVYGDVENPLFLAKDVAEWIDYAKRPDGSYQVSAMLSSIDEEEKIKIYTTVNNLNGGSVPFLRGEKQLNREKLMLTSDGYAYFMKKNRRFLIMRDLARIFKDCKDSLSIKEANK